MPVSVSVMICEIPISTHLWWSVMICDEPKQVALGQSWDNHVCVSWMALQSKGIVPFQYSILQSILHVHQCSIDCTRFHHSQSKSRTPKHMVVGWLARHLATSNSAKLRVAVHWVAIFLKGQIDTCTYNRLSVGTSNFLRKSASKSWPQIFWALENHGTWPFIDSCIIFNIRIWAH